MINAAVSRLLFAAVLWVLTADVLAESTRPKVGLALSGGGTKAGAHIGVLRVLEELQVPIDYIAGTSAGAIIGSLYAAGLSPDEIENVIAGIDWDDMLEDSPARADLPFRRKRDSYNYLVDYRPGYNDGAVTLPMGIVNGQKVVQFFRRNLAQSGGTTDFDTLGIPLRVVATDLVTGAAVVIDSGDLPIAVRASMAIPFVFSPVEIDGRMLVDGGPANNLPVDIVRQMGADVVIAVDITAPLLSADALDSALAAAYQMTNLLTQRTVQEQLTSLSERDIHIRPDVARYGELDFENILAPVGAGEQAAQAARSALAPLALDKQAYRTHLARRERQQHAEGLVIRDIEIRNASHLDSRTLRRRLGLKVGEPFDIDRIEQGISEIYGLDLFERVDYRVQALPSGARLHIDAVPNSWGPNYLQFGIRLSEDFSQGSEFNLGVAYLRTEINRLRGEWRAQLDLGERQGISVNWYQPLSAEGGWFFEGEALRTRRNFRFFDGDAATAELRVDGWGGSLSTGAELGQWGELRLGWNRFSGDADVTIGTAALPDDSADIGEYFVNLQYDKLDSVNFPRHGVAGGIGFTWSRPSAGAVAAFEQIGGGLFVAQSWGDYSVLASVEGGTTLDDDAPLESQFLLGGLGRLSGFPAARFAGQHYGLGSVFVLKRLQRNFWVPAYAGFSVEAGNVWQDASDISGGDVRWAGAALAGADTPIGPVYLAFGLAEGGENTFYLYLGNPFVSQGARPLD